MNPATSHLTAALNTPGDWLLAFFSIVLIDIVLAGDNAIAIALAVRNLPPEKRLLGISIGAGFAVVLRIALTSVIASLLAMRYVKLVGGLLILWIAVKLLLETADEVEGRGEARALWHAIGLVVLADLSMSLDNVLAVAGASRGNYWLLAFGLALSIPIVVFASNLLSKLMERYPAIAYVGSAILGKVGAEMIMTDPFVSERLQPTHGVTLLVEAVSAAGVVFIPLLIVRRNGQNQTREPTEAS